MALWSDLKLALRGLAKSPGFTTLAVMTLALGIGASTAIFSVVDATLLRALPFDEPQRLVFMHYHPPGEPNVFLDVSYPDYLDWKTHTTSFESLAAVPVTPGRAFVDVQGEPLPIGASPVSAELFSVLGIPPLLGRDFVPSDDRVGAERVVIIGFRLWHRLYGASEEVLGRSIEIDGLRHRIVGVMPQGFEFPVGAELWTPLVPVIAQVLETRNVAFLQIIGRLREDVSIAEARDDVQRVIDEVTSKSWTTRVAAGAAVTSLREHLLGDAESPLLLLFGASGLLLLIACANVSNLLVARGTSRREELALRRALGADTFRIVLQLLVEGAVLAAAGGLTGLGLASVFLAGVKASGIEIFRFAEIGMDVRCLLFSCTCSAATVFLFALLPALQQARAAISVGSRAPRRGKLSAYLVAAEVSLALLLLVAAGLLVESFNNLSRVDTGFEADDVMSFHILIPEGMYEEETEWRNLYRSLIERVRADPEVRAAAGMLLRPLESPEGFDSWFTIEGQSADEQGLNPFVHLQAVTEEFFSVARLGIRSGRSFTETDRESAEPVAIVSEGLARRYWPGESAIGKRLKLGNPESPYPWLTVVGVAHDARFRRLDRAGLELYVPYRQDPWRLGYLIVQSRTDPAATVPVVRRELAALDPRLRAAAPRTLGEMVAGALARPRFNTVVLGLFAIAATLLGAVGVYAMMSFEAVRKRHEVGIRMALGASRASVLRLFLRDALSLVLPGVGIGIAAAVGSTRLLESLLFQVSTADLRTFIAVPIGLTAIAVLAAGIPAHRAASADPTQSLRSE